ncbi:MAG: 3-methyladenine DNA glycosylase [Sulfurospirillum sp.]|nr:MAG: 3-methyladenine DNA glycosylase [Sulfurospirillum sp.]
MTNSYELLVALKKLGYIKDERDPLWWPNALTFEVVVGALLTQQTKWEKVEKSLANLHEAGLMHLEALADADLKQLQMLVKPSGFYNTKAKRLKQLCINIREDFGSFEQFQQEVEREWLLAQKGVGEETADSILSYACGREAMVVDSYTQRILGALGYQFESYGEIQNWLIEGLLANLTHISKLYGKELPVSTIYSRFHGKIVEYAKVHIRGKCVNIEELCP